MRLISDDTAVSTTVTKHMLVMLWMNIITNLARHSSKLSLPLKSYLTVQSQVVLISVISIVSSCISVYLYNIQCIYNIHASAMPDQMFPVSTTCVFCCSCSAAGWSIGKQGNRILRLQSVVTSGLSEYCFIFGFLEKR